MGQEKVFLLPPEKILNIVIRALIDIEEHTHSQC